ncbi:hypothetical protein B0O80DRAFT_28243 [Mortierella sp. GBAus27b]|nr:hypothetical protein B0O80DRAFT_28243 [Mortierella sp. GBAus27b]
MEIIDDDDWISTARDVIKRHPSNDPLTLTGRLLMASSDPQCIPDNEKERQTMRNLLDFGLVVEKADYQNSDVPLAQHIASSLLNSTTIRHNFCLHIGSDPRSQMIIPSRSLLLLRHISYTLNINIFLFSTRASTIVFKPETATTSIGLLHRICSVNGVSEYLVVVASRHIVPSGPRPPPDEDDRIVPFKAATFRHTERVKSTHCHQRTVTNAQCRAGVKRSFHEYIQAQVSKTIVETTKTKKFKDGDGEEQDIILQTARTKLLTALQSRNSVPRGSLQVAYTMIKDHHNDPEFNYGHLESLLKTAPKGIDIWKQTVDSEFDSSWTSKMDEEQDKPEPEQEDVKSGCSKDIRTCTVSLSDIIRHDMKDERPRIIELAAGAQKTITDTIDELSCIAMKTVFTVASGELHGFSDEMDVLDLLPFGFEPRRNINSKIKIARIPKDLQDQIVSVLDPDETTSSVVTDPDIIDMAHILTQSHLQHLYTRFLGPNQETAAESQRDHHQLWKKIDNALDKTIVNRPTPTPPGISKTVTEHIREFSTSISNLWSGNILQKCLDYLLRVLLRVHLAPIRESKTRQRKDKPIAPRSEGVSGSMLKTRLLDLCNELAIVQELPLSDKRTHRTTAILLQIDKLQHTSRSPKMQQTFAVQSLDLDDLDDFDEPDEEDVTADPPESSSSRAPSNEPSPKEPSARHLRSLQAVLRTLLESPHVKRRITPGDIQRAAFKGLTISAQESSIMADIGNALWPYVPKRRVSPDGTTATSFPHLALRAPLVMIANCVLTMTGYTEFTRKISPLVSSGAMHGLALGAVGLYEVFCGQTKDRFDTFDINGTPLTNVGEVTRVPGNKKAIIGSFFDLRKIDEVCKKHGLVFADRLTYISPYQIRLTGTAIQSEHRNPTTSPYDDKRKRNHGNPNRVRWADEFAATGLDKKTVGQFADDAAEKVKGIEARIKPLRKDTAAKTSELTKVSRDFRLKEAGKKDSDVEYKDLSLARRNQREGSQELASLEEDLRRERSELYFWNQVHNAAESPTKTNRTLPDFSTPVWSKHAVEDYTECLDIRELLETHGTRHPTTGREQRIAFSGTDYGIVKMSVCVPQTLPEIHTHLNRFQVLAGHAGHGRQSPAQIICTRHSKDVRHNQSKHQ